MNDVQKLEISSLAAIAHEKRQRFHMLGMMNAAGLTPQESAQQSMQYAVAQADLMNAESALLYAQIKAARSEP